jgi:hypothetical protein
VKRRAIEALLGRRITDAEWLVACDLFDSIERHPDGEAVMSRCIERKLSVEETIAELCKLPPTQPEHAQ